MAAEWEFEHSIFTIAGSRDAWAYWTDMRNHEEEPGVKSIELDGPFETGTTGRTIATDFTQEWELTEVAEGRRFIITGLTPDGNGSLSFAWHFEDEGSGTRMTQRIRATGPEVEENMEVFRQMEVHAPDAMAHLAAQLDRVAEQRRQSD